MDIIEHALTRISKVCKIISILLMIFLIVIAIWWTVVAISMGLSLAGFNYFNDEDATLSGLFIFLGYGIVVVTLLLIMYRIFSETGKKQPPFTMVQVTRLRIIAILLVLYTVLDFAASYQISSLQFGQTLSSFIVAGDDSSFTLNFAPLITAAAVYAFSFVFKYGVLLHEESESVC